LDKRQTALSKSLQRPFPYGEKGKSVPAAVFLQERFATLLLCSNRYRCIAYDPVGTQTSLLPNGFGEEVNNALRLCDALKESYRQTPSDQYLKSFYQLREAALGTPQTLKENLSVALNAISVADRSRVSVPV
jgi:hypothetical protein